MRSCSGCHLESSAPKSLGTLHKLDRYNLSKACCGWSYTLCLRSPSLLFSVLLCIKLLLVIKGRPCVSHLPSSRRSYSCHYNLFLVFMRDLNSITLINVYLLLAQSSFSVHLQERLALIPTATSGCCLLCSGDPFLCVTS